jgi:SP family sugar:H+ symporter-like MFS transporter
LSLSFFCIAFVWYMIYETKGLALEEVDELYGAVDKAWKSKAFRPTLSFRDVQTAGEKRASLADEYEGRTSSVRAATAQATAQEGAAVQGN